MTETQARSWLIKNGHCKDRDYSAGEGYLPEAIIDVDPEHVEIVMALNSEIRKEYKEYFKKADQRITELEGALGQIGRGMQ